MLVLECTQKTTKLMNTLKVGTVPWCPPPKKNNNKKTVLVYLKQGLVFILKISRPPTLRHALIQMTNIEVVV